MPAAVFGPERLRALISALRLFFKRHDSGEVPLVEVEDLGFGKVE